MSDTKDTDVPFAKKDACNRWRKTRRFDDFPWPGVGKVVLQSAMAGEWIKIDSARTRARLAAMSGNAALHEKATRDFILNSFNLLVLDEEHNPFFSADDRELILEMDSAITDPLIEACMAHCNIDAIDLGAEQKK